MKNNGWSVDLFAIEVGARGYCAETVKSCLLRLGYFGKDLRKILKSLIAQSLKSSFEIWLSRDTFAWNFKQSSTSNFENNLCNNMSQNTIVKNDKPASFPTKTNNKCREKCPSIDFEKSDFRITGRKNCGILNKGNTCYLNASLQCLSTMVSFWSNLTSFSTSISPFVSSFLKIMSILRSSKQPIDPSDFLRHLQNVLVKSGKPYFDLFQQQDAAEILTCILEELSASNPLAKNMVKVSIRVKVTCDSCDEDNLKEDVSTILQVPVKANLQSCLNAFLAPNQLDGSNSVFCNVCQAQKPAALSQNLSDVGQYLILQTKRFIRQGSLFTKHLQKIVCSPNLVVPVLDQNGTVEQRHFKLLGTINHTGSLNRGHYTSYIKLVSKDSWYHCNDAAVVLSKGDQVNNESSYLYFFERV